MTDNTNNMDFDQSIALGSLIKPDNPKLEKIKNLYLLEVSYLDYLINIKTSIASYFSYHDKTITDKDVRNAIKNIKHNMETEIGSLNTDFEKLVAMELAKQVEDSPLTSHELNLVLDHIIAEIENLSWIEDEQAFVKRSAYILDYLSDEDIYNYETEIEDIIDEMGLPYVQTEFFLLKEDSDVVLEEEHELEPEIFEMDEDEILRIVPEDCDEAYNFLQKYVLELAESGQFDKLERFYDKFVEEYKTYIPIYLFMSMAYLDHDPEVARSYIDHALEVIETIDNFSVAEKADLKSSLTDMLEQIETMLN